MSPVTSAVALVLALAATATFAADPVYKSTMPDGRIVYGEVPMQGAKRVDKVAAPPEQSGVVVATQEEKSRAAGIQPQQGGVSVIPQAPKYPAKAAQQGYLANPGGNLTRY